MDKKIIKSNKKRSIENWLTSDLISILDSGELDLTTEYQREVIWSRSQKQLLIDSVLEDIDIPKIYLAYFVKEHKYECIDGKQRISSILDFYNNNLKTIDGKTFEELSDQSDFLKYSFSISIIHEPTDEHISKLFYRLNLGEPLNGGEKLHALRGDMRNFIFDTMGKESAPFISKVGMKGKVGSKVYRFSREIVLAQIIMNSLFFRQTSNFIRVRYEDIHKFLNLPENKTFSQATTKKIDKYKLTLKKIELVFGHNMSKLNRKSAIVSAYLFCEELIEKKGEKNLDKFPDFYVQLLEEVKAQAVLIKRYETPTKKILLQDFQKNLQQASNEGYSTDRRQKFLEKAFVHYLKTGEIIGDDNI